MEPRTLGIFTASLAETGEELWITDGTEEGTHLLADLRPGAAGSDPRDGTVAGGRLFFTADDGAHGRELWVTDGTTEGTRLLDTATGALSGNPENLTVVGDKLFFTADDGVHGRELWVSDGTAAGTRMVRDLRPGPAGSDPEELVALDGRVYFRAFDAEHGAELWRSDGTLSGTDLFYETEPGAASALARNLLAVPNGGLAVTEWRYGRAELRFLRDDGSAVDFSSFDPILAVAERFSYTRTEAGLFVAASELVDRQETEWGVFDTWRTSFWTTDGTAEGTRHLDNLTLGQRWEPPQGLAVHGDDFVFSTRLYTLRIEEGTPSLLAVVDGASGAVSFIGSQWHDSEAVGRAGEGPDAPIIVKVNSDPGWSGGSSIVATDGTPEGTVELHRLDDDYAAYESAKVAGGHVFFLGDDALWSTDGTPAGTRELLPANNYLSTLLGDLDGEMLALLAELGGPDRLVLSDGTAAGTRSLGAFEFNDFPELLGTLVPSEPGSEPEPEIVRGTEGGDLLIGDDGNNRIHALAGDDRLIARGGDDRLNGGAGNDFLSGGDGKDRLYGMEGNDVLEPGRGRDIVDGGAGDDVILVERDGESDQFFFAPGCGKDVLTAFDPRLDIIMLQGFGADAGSAAWRDEHVAALDGAAYVDLGNGDGILVLDTAVQDLRFLAIDPLV
jgi:ELWxxDGT repeat protein